MAKWVAPRATSTCLNKIQTCSIAKLASLTNQSKATVFSKLPFKTKVWTNIWTKPWTFILMELRIKIVRTWLEGWQGRKTWEINEGKGWLRAILRIDQGRCSLIRKSKRILISHMVDYLHQRIITMLSISRRFMQMGPIRRPLHSTQILWERREIWMSTIYQTVKLKMGLPPNTVEWVLIELDNWRPIQVINHKPKAHFNPQSPLQVVGHDQVGPTPVAKPKPHLMPSKAHPNSLKTFKISKSHNLSNNYTSTSKRQLLLLWHQQLQPVE